MKAAILKKPVLTLDEPHQRVVPERADIPPAEGFVLTVDGHFKTKYATAKAAEEAGRVLKAKYDRVQIQIYDAAAKTRTPLD